MKPETVVLCNKIYCWVRAAGWFIAGIACFAARGNLGQIYDASRETFDSAGIKQEQLLLIYTSLGAFGILFCILNVALALAPMTRKWWAAHLINHIVGILECCCLPMGLPLVILWFRKDVQAMFDEPFPAGNRDSVG